MKEIYIKRLLRSTKEGQGFYCSEVYKINKGLSKAPLKLLKRNNKPLFLLERQEVVIPMGEYFLGADFAGKHQIAKVLNVPNRENIEIHAANYLHQTSGCLLLGQNYDDNKHYSNQDIIINESKDSCNWFKFAFLLNDEENKQTRRVEQDEIIGRITINA